jgi:hypothetical protein
MINCYHVDEEIFTMIVDLALRAKVEC